MKKKEIKIHESLNHDWSILCSGSSVDEKSNLLSLFSMLETINATILLDEHQTKVYKEKGWYALPFGLWLVTRLIKKDLDLDLDFDLQYKIFDPSNKHIGKEFGNTIKFAKGQDSLRIRNQIGNIPLTKSGWYRIAVSVKEPSANKFYEIGDMPFRVEINLQELEKEKKTKK